MIRPPHKDGLPSIPYPQVAKNTLNSSALQILAISKDIKSASNA
jgi:hypothetical protein